MKNALIRTRPNRFLQRCLRGNPINTSKHALRPVKLIRRSLQPEHGRSVHGPSKVNRVGRVFGSLQLREYLGKRKLRAPVEHQADHALAVVLHQQNDGSGKIRIPKLPAGHQHSSQPKIPRIPRHPRRKINPPYLGPAGRVAADPLARPGTLPKIRAKRKKHIRLPTRRVRNHGEHQAEPELTQRHPHDDHRTHAHANYMQQN